MMFDGTCHWLLAESFRQSLHTTASCSLGFLQRSSCFQRETCPELWRKRQPRLDILYVPASRVTWIPLCCLRPFHRSTQVQGGEWSPLLVEACCCSRGGRSCREDKVTRASSGNTVSPNGLHVPCTAFSFVLIQHCQGQRCLPCGHCSLVEPQRTILRAPLRIQRTLSSIIVLETLASNETRLYYSNTGKTA